MDDVFDDWDDWDDYDEFYDWDSWGGMIYDSQRDDVIYDSLDGLLDEGALDCYAYYGKISHISIDRGQRQPLDSELWQPADLLEVFRNVYVTHMTEHLEDAIDIMRDATIGLDAKLNFLGRSVVCGRLELRFPAIPWDDVLHYLESVK